MRERTRPVDPVVASRRRFEQRQWARRWGTWRAAVVAAVVLLAVVISAWAVFFSSLLAVDGVDVAGASQLSKSRVEQAAAVPIGDPLARADLEAIRARVEGLAGVKSADVTRSWPNQVRIEIVERQAVAVIDEGDRLRGLDSEGVVFRTFQERPEGLPLIRIAPDTRADAMTEAAEVVGTLPQKVARKVAYVDVKTRDEIILTLKRGKTVLWGSADSSEDKALVLEAMLEARPGASAYDVSVPGQPTSR